MPSPPVCLCLTTSDTFSVVTNHTNPACPFYRATAGVTFVPVAERDAALAEVERLREALGTIKASNSLSAARNVAHTALGRRA